MKLIQPASLVRLVSCISLLVLFATSCSLAPLTPRVDAASVGKGVFKIENNLSPTNSLGLVYGAGESFDIGFEIEQLVLGTVWGRYSLINNPNGFSLAANGGVFVYTGEQESNGFYTGLIVSNQWHPKFRTTGGVRYAALDYQFTPDDNVDSFFNIDPVGLGFDNADDGAVNVQVDLTLSFLVKPYIELAVGGVCQHLPDNKDPFQDSDFCWPTIGFSYYRP